MAKTDAISRADTLAKPDANAGLHMDDFLELLSPVEVLGDGSCWVYAIGACLGLLEHGWSKDPGTQGCITARDQEFDLAVRQALYNDGHDAELLLVPKYTKNACTELGSWGGTNQWSSMSKLLDIDIISLDAADTDKQAYNFAWINGLKHVRTFPQDLINRVQNPTPNDRPLVTVVYDAASEHFTAYVHPKTAAAYVVPSWLVHITRRRTRSAAHTAATNRSCNETADVLP